MPTLALNASQPGTRAYFRGRSLEKFGSSVHSLNWDSIEFELNGKVARLDLKACVDEETAAYFNDALDRAGTVQELLEHLSDRAQP